MGLITNKIERGQLKPGDHIYTYRTGYLYPHHGIYVGGDQVIHFTISEEEKKGGFQSSFQSSSSSSSAGAPICYKCGDQSRLSGVISSCLDCFLRGGDIRLYEYGVSKAYLLAGVRNTCTLASADPVEDVLHRAFYLLRNGFGVYDLFKNNCVDFAIYCKTGLIITSESSGWVSTAVTTGAVVSGLFGFVGVGFGINSGRRLVCDVGFRKDVIKVPVERLEDVMRRR